MNVLYAFHWFLELKAGPLSRVFNHDINMSGGIILQVHPSHCPRGLSPWVHVSRVLGRLARLRTRDWSQGLRSPVAVKLKTLKRILLKICMTPTRWTLNPYKLLWCNWHRIQYRTHLWNCTLWLHIRTSLVYIHPKAFVPIRTHDMFGDL